MTPSPLVRVTVAFSCGHTRPIWTPADKAEQTTRSYPCWPCEMARIGIDPDAAIVMPRTSAPDSAERRRKSGARHTAAWRTQGA